jgi:hypothetical protein
VGKIGFVVGSNVMATTSDVGFAVGSFVSMVGCMVGGGLLLVGCAVGCNDAGGQVGLIGFLVGVNVMPTISDVGFAVGPLVSDVGYNMVGVTDSATI